jgi:hypothetical protein
MRNFLLSVLLLLLCPNWAAAVVVSDLYQAAVPVDDHSQQQLRSATKRALARVMVKVSGSRQAANAPEVRTAMGRAEEFLQQYQYLRGEDALAVLVQFDERLVTELVLAAGLPLWTANRPPVLLWLVVDDRDGRQFAGADFPEGLRELVQQEFDRRGVPVVFPLLDLQDATSLSVQDVWELRSLPVMRASERYDVADILVGRITETSQGQWLGEWMYTGQGGRSEQSGIRLRVDGLASFADYRAVVDYLESVELIDAVHAKFVSGDAAVLQLSAQASAEQLRRIIGLSRHLLPVDTPLPLAGAQPTDLDYQWIP